MASTVITITHADSTADMANRLGTAATDPKRMAIRLCDYLEGLAGGMYKAAIDVQVAEGAATYASGTYTLGTIAANDTAVINNVTFTAKVSPSGDNEFAVGASDNATATNLAAKVNASALAGVTGVVTAAATSGVAEVSTVTLVADTGRFEVSQAIAVADVAGSLNSTYWLFEDTTTTHKYYVWYNINAAGVDPAVATRTGIEVAGATGATAATLGGATRTAIGLSTAATYFTVTGATTTTILTSKTIGTQVDAADGAAPTGFAITTTTQGAASNLQSKYFTIKIANDATSYYAWFNISSLGVDPAPGGTGIPIAFTAGASAATIATAAALAIDALAGFVAPAPAAAIVTITNASIGIATNITAGNSGLTVGVTTGGTDPTVVVTAYRKGLMGNAITIAGTGGFSAGAARLAGGTDATANAYHFGA